MARARAPLHHSAIIALLALHLGVLFTQWASWQPIYAEYRAAFAKLPPNAKLLYVHVTPAITDLTAHPPVGHIASLAVTERGALIPSLFADVGHQLLVYKEPYRALSTTAPTAADAPFYDYILFLHPGNLDLGAYPAYQPIAEGSTFILGRLLH